MAGETVLPLEDFDLSGLGLRTKRRFRATVGEDDGSEGLGVPIDVIVGTRQRPFLAVVAGVHGDEYDDVPAGATGLFTPSVSLLEEVQPGDMLGTVLDPYGDKVADVWAPVRGVVGCYREFSGVRADDTVVIIWSPGELMVG